MKLMYTGHRFHTNMIPTVNGLYNDGHEVFYYVQTVKPNEQHDNVSLSEMTLSFMGKIVSKAVNKFYPPSIAEQKMVPLFIPSYKKVLEHLKETSPDVVIMRERNFSSIRVYRACKKLKIKPVIIYNQNTLYVRKDKKQNIVKRLFFKMNPPVRYTVSKIHNPDDLEKYKDLLYIQPHNYYVPFVGSPNPDSENREYCKNGIINILCSGKYRAYKNQKVVVQAMKKLKDLGKDSNVRITFLGQALSDEEKEYKQNLINMVHEYDLDDKFTFVDMIPYKEMPNFYRQFDVLVISSLNELATISVVEAMSNSLMVISTNSNGTAFHVTPKETGLLFKTNNPDSLSEQLLYLLEDEERIQTMAKAGYSYISTHCSYENFKKYMNEMLSEEFSIQL